MITLGASDSGSRHDVRVGERVALVLDERPTTGYRWQVEADPPLVRIVDDGFDAATSLTGGGGRHTFTLEATGAGTTVVRARNVRAWQPDQPVERFEATLAIAGD